MRTREERVHRTLRATALLDDPLLREAFDGAEAEFTQTWKDSHSPEQREAAWALVRALDTVRRKLHSIAADGRYAQAALDRGRDEG